MTKYRVIGVFNLLLGISEVFIPLMILITVIPKLTTLYSNLNTGTGMPSFVYVYLAAGISALVGIGNIFFGFNLILNLEKQEKYFKYASMLLILSFILFGYLINFIIFSVITPIYALSSQL